MQESLTKMRLEKQKVERRLEELTSELGHARTEADALLSAAEGTKGEEGRLS